MDMHELKQFIYAASRATYASGDESIQERQPDGSTSIRFADGAYSFHDNYFGGEPFGGREVVFYKERPLWIMVYYGAVIDGPNGEIYTFLMKALSNNTVDMPYRGPQTYTDGIWSYANNLTGDVERFSGREEIFKEGVPVYHADYIGGLVDR